MGSEAMLLKTDPRRASATKSPMANAISLPRNQSARMVLSATVMFSPPSPKMTRPISTTGTLEMEALADCDLIIEAVFENLELATASNKHVWYTLNKSLTGEQLDRIDEVLKLIGLKEQFRMEAGALSHGQKQWLEIGMLLMQNPRVLLVDEPVAGMTGEEVEHTAELLTSLAGRHSVIVVEHDMAFVRSIARKVTVLHQGSVLAEGSMDQVQNDPRVVEVYLGE